MSDIYRFDLEDFSRKLLEISAPYMGMLQNALTEELPKEGGPDDHVFFVATLAANMVAAFSLPGAERSVLVSAMKTYLQTAGLEVVDTGHA
jgi:hypothetical protein